MEELRRVLQWLLPALIVVGLLGWVLVSSGFIVLLQVLGVGVGVFLFFLLVTWLYLE